MLNKKKHSKQRDRREVRTARECSDNIVIEIEEWLKDRMPLRPLKKQSQPIS